MSYQMKQGPDEENQKWKNGNSSGEKSTWKCDLGNGEFDHDWKKVHDSAGEVDGGPGDHWSYRECRVCGEIEQGE